MIKLDSFYFTTVKRMADIFAENCRIQSKLYKCRTEMSAAMFYIAKLKFDSAYQCCKTMICSFNMKRKQKVDKSEMVRFVPSLF